LRIRALNLANFRNFSRLTVEFGERRNVILGANAAGKTSILEALHLLGVGRSHRERCDANLVRFGEDYYRVEGVFDHIGVRTTIEVTYAADAKRIRVNGKDARASDLIGLAAVVVTSPEDIDLVKGGPRGRRRFLDIAISQSSRDYLASLQHYLRALTQRNALLRQARDGDRTDTAVWDAALVEAGARVVAARMAFLEFLSPRVEAHFGVISGRAAATSLVYEPRGYGVDVAGAGAGPDVDGLAAALLAGLERSRENERARGFTLVGPHVDDFRFLADGYDLRQFGSEGEQRTAVLALRCAEAGAIEEKLGKAPIVLLDDVFAELDDARAGALISLISGFDQIVLTSSRRSPLGDEKVHRIHVEDGGVTYDGEA